MNDVKFIFEIETPLGFAVRCTESYWEFISTEKHPVMAGKIDLVKIALSNPDEIRKSKKDENVFLFYRGEHPKWIVVVAKKEDGFGFLITTYPTDVIKVGEVVWKK
jgi:hypothetical protein